jgi:hypothetical protein
VKRAYKPERLSEVTIEVNNTADSVLIKTKYPERNLNFEGRNRENNPASVEYTLTIPAERVLMAPSWSTVHWTSKEFRVMCRRPG